MIYRIGKEIGYGGFGSVHECTSERGDKYAIKILNSLDSEATERFEKEIRITKRLSHPNIVKVIAYNTIDNNKYYIMPLYNSSLANVIPNLYNHYDRQYDVISEILNGVIYLHAEGILHRDLKPQNILYNSDSDIVINDLGLGRQISSESDRLTHTGYGMGTLRYSAPEQLTDAKQATEQSDIFSLGRIIEDIVTNMQNCDIPTDDFEYIINKCTEANPKKRFDSVVELKSAIDSVYQQLLAIVENDKIEEMLKKIKIRDFNSNDIQELAHKLLNCENPDKIEEFFYSLPNENFKVLESQNNIIVQKLIVRLQEYLTGQGWGFGYTDTICNNCNRIYGISDDILVKAHLLYTIIEVGISHNRFYVIGVASNLLRNAKNNIAECIELSNLIKNTYVDLSRLDIKKTDVPPCLQSYF